MSTVFCRLSYTAPSTTSHRASAPRPLPRLPRISLTSSSSSRSRICTMASKAGAHHNSNLSTAELHSLPGVQATPDPATVGTVFQQTMFRIKDPKASLDFYTRVIGMTLIERLDFADMEFSLYFLAFVADPASIPDDRKQRIQWMFAQPACLEVTHNWGTESDPEFKGYHNGNSDPRGFGHIGIAVPDVEAASERWASLGVEFVKKPEDGKMKGIAFIKDPDGYWIEVLCPAKSAAFTAWPGNQAEVV